MGGETRLPAAISRVQLSRCVWCCFWNASNAGHSEQHQGASIRSSYSGPKVKAPASKRRSIAIGRRGSHLPDGQTTQWAAGTPASEAGRSQPFAPLEFAAPPRDLHSVVLATHPASLPLTQQTGTVTAPRLTPWQFGNGCAAAENDTSKRATLTTIIGYDIRHSCRWSIGSVFACEDGQTLAPLRGSARTVQHPPAQ
jgi:hypothetical protein